MSTTHQNKKRPSSGDANNKAEGVDTKKVKPANVDEGTEGVQDAEPELYVTIPQQPKEKKPGQLTREQLEQYFEEGYLMIPDFFQTSELDPVREGVAEAVDELVQKLYAAGKIKDKCSDAGLFQRIILIDKQFPGAAVLLHKTGYLPKGFRDLWSNDRLLNVMEQMIGPSDIAGHPVWNLRVKTPKNEQSVVPWHQDNAYLDLDALHVLQPTAWIPLLDVNANNGCMQVVPRGHCNGVTGVHNCCVGGTWYVQLKDDEEVKSSLGVDVKDAVTVDMPYGGVLFMNNAIPHRSLTNLSGGTRWSLDLRWQRADKPNGFYGIKDSLLMRTSKDPNHVINFDKFDLVNRHNKALDSASDMREALKEYVENEDDFDTTIFGPWMKRWELVHHNRHTEKFEQQDQDKDTLTEMSYHP